MKQAAVNWKFLPRDARVRTRDVKTIVDDAEAEFRWCWKVLSGLRQRRKRARLQDLVRWQPRLAKAIFALEHCYHHLKRQDKALIGRKSELTDSYLRKQLRCTRKLRGILNRTIDTGRALGDTFAWPFYSREHKLLAEHQKHRPLARMAVGTGGIGEITYLENLPIVNHYLVIYHGTTTFLRLGDFSMVHMGTMNINAIGELKSHFVTKTEIRITASLIGDNVADDDLLPREAFRHPAMEASEMPRLSASQADRLKRQIDAIRAAFKPSPLPQVGDSSVHADWNSSKVEQVAQKSTRARASFIRVDRGLLLVGVKTRPRTLWSKFTPAHKAGSMSVLDGVVEAAKQIVDKSLPDNSVTVGWLGYPATGRYSLLAGMRPVGCWPIANGVAEALLFRDLAVMTLFNPAFLVKDLRDAGFAVTTDLGKLSVTKPSEDKTLMIAGFDHFLQFIQGFLFSEAAALRLIEDFTARVDDAKFTRPSAISVDLRFEYQ